jgi:hypothetical protein
MKRAKKQAPVEPVEDPNARPDGFDALPKRFKAYIQRVEGDRDRLKSQLPTTTKTKVWIASHGPKGSEAYLPSDSRIRFKIGPADNHTVECYVDRHQPNRLRLYGGDWLAIVPESGNTASVVLIRTEPVAGEG